MNKASYIEGSVLNTIFLTHKHILFGNYNIIYTLINVQETLGMLRLYCYVCSVCYFFALCLFLYALVIVHVYGMCVLHSFFSHN